MSNLRPAPTIDAAALARLLDSLPANDRAPAHQELAMALRTPTHVALLDWLQRTIEQGDPSPTDAKIADKFGLMNRDQARLLLADLADAGRITIRGWGDDRVITLGRTRPASPVAPRPTPAVQRRDVALEAGVAKIAAIINRGRTPAPSPDPQPAKEAPTVSEFANVNVHLRGAALDAVRDHSARNALTLGQATAALIKRATEEPAPAAPDGLLEGSAVILANLPDADLVAELVRRYETCVGSDDHDAAIARADAAVARAEAAEGQLATIRAQLAGLLGA